MAEWMEFLYMQKPMPNANGVPVKLVAVDANGNSMDIGTAVSDSSGIYALTWTPTATGQYKIVAAFEGSDSYWPSCAETVVSVSAAAAAPAPEEATVDNTMSIIIIVVVIIGILIGLANMMALRKK
jgi:hypothetical protein